MDPEYLRFVGMVVAIAAVMFGVGRRSLERWAADERVRLVEFKTAPFWRGPRAWLRTENQEDHFVVVEDRHGKRRTGWVLFTWPWHGLGSKKVSVRWDEVA